MTKHDPTAAEARLDAMIADAVTGEGDLDAMTERLAAALADDRGAQRALARRYESRMVRLAVSEAVRRDRDHIWNAADAAQSEAGAIPPSAPNPAAPPSRSPQGDFRGRRAAEALRNAVEASLMAFPLPGGKRLGDGTRADVESAAARYHAISRDTGWKAAWLRRVAEALPDDEARVAAAISEARLRQMKESAA